MNPEDRMKLLRDPDQWNVRLSARAGAFPARRISPLFLSIATVATVAIVGVILFAVFGASVRAIRDPELPPASPQPTATAIAQPEQVFGGDCANVFTDEQLASFGDSSFTLGAGGTPTSYPNDDDFSFVIEQVGGIDCNWTGDDGWIKVALFPSAVAPSIDDETCGPGYGEGTAGPNFCGIQQEMNGIRITGGISATDASTAQSISPKIIAAFDTAATLSTVPVNPDIAGAWTNPVDCGALDSAIDAESVFGSGVTYQPEVGGDEGIYLPLRSYTNELMGLSCYWSQQNGASSATVSVHGGGRWNESAIAKLDTVTPIDIEGIDAAYLEEGTPNGTLLHVFDGPNWLIILAIPNDPASMESTAVTLVDALDASEVSASTAVNLPTQIFDGDCSAIFTDAEAASLLGTDAEPYAGSKDETSDYGWSDNLLAVEQAGGMFCTWQKPAAEGTSSDAGIYLAVLYESTLDPLEKEESCAEGYSEGLYGENVCTIEHTVNGIRISGGVRSLSTNHADAEQLARNVIDGFDDKALALDGVAAPTPVSGAWNNPVDCAALSENLDIDAAIGAGYQPYPDGLGGSNSESKATWDLLQPDQSLRCYWIAGEGTGDWVRVGLLGGGAWLANEVAPLGNATPVTLDGFDRAYVIDSENYEDMILVTVGVNALFTNFYGEGDTAQSLAPRLRAIAAALDGMPTSTGGDPVTEQPESSAVQITSTGLGDLVIGEKVPADTTLVEWNAQVCGGQWVPTGEDQQNFASSFWVETTDGKKGSPILRITVLSSDYATSSGVRVGSTLDELKAASPTFEKVDKTQSLDVNLYVLEKSVAQTVFTVIKPGRSLEDAAENSVAYIKVEAASLLAHPVPQESCGA